MDIYTTSFTYPRRNRQSHAHDLPSAGGAQGDHPFPSNGSAVAGGDGGQLAQTPADTEAVHKLALNVMSVHGCHTSIAVANAGRGWNFLVSGAYQQVMLGRGMIMKDCPFKSKVSIRVPRSEILDTPATKPAIKAEVRRRLDEIASHTGAHIAVVNSSSALSSRTPPDGISSSAGWSGLETERVCELVITGHGDAIEIARVRLLAMLDELSGLHAEAIEIDRKLHAIIAGRKRHVVQSIQEETATNIYFPSPLQGLVGPDIPPTAAAPAVAGAPPKLNCNVIWITGEFFGVQRARDMLFQVSVTKTKSVVSRDSAILPRKLDWMVTDRTDDLKAIMHDNATFIQFPPLGSSTSLITVFGDHRVNIQRTIRSIMQLACQYYVASFWLLPVQFNILMPPPPLNAGQVAAIIQQISSTTGAEVVFKGMCFEVHGLESEVRAAVLVLLDLEIVKAYHHEIRFQIELASEHRDFISGMKNGKINKIMQTTGIKIKFETFNDQNFLIDISGSDGSVLAGLGLLQEELPAELSFHVPEGYHKRIIGVGGKSIQRIMKKYGVYVKFSNAEEFAALGGYNDNEDNVVARTPAKNAINLENLKGAVMDMVTQKDKDYINESVSIPRRYHRTLLGEKAIFIHDIEAKTNSRVRFPDKELASDVVSVFGPESQVQIAATMLLDHVPFEADMSVPPHVDLPHLCATPDFAAFVERTKREYQVVISPNMKPVAANSQSGTEIGPSECTFKFRCQRSNTDSLVTAREMLEQFLLNHNFHVYPSPTAHTHKRGDSFTSAFPHFNSKLLATMRTRGTESADLGRPSASVVDRRLRMASSTPDVKALFNGTPSYIYNKLEEPVEAVEELDSPAYGADDADSHWTPLPPPPIGSGYIHHRSRHSEDAIKRGSDSLLESKLRDTLSHPRSISNRAQSLDLTHSLSRITEGSAAARSASGGSHDPDSPTETEFTATSNSPNSGTTPLFPSVYPNAPVSNRGTGAPGTPQSMRRGPTLEEEVQEVSRVISNLGL